MKEIILNQKQKDLYNYLLENEGKTLHKADIVDHFPTYYVDEERKTSSQSHYILDDIKKLNASPDIEKIIVYEKGNIKIANPEEAMKYALYFFEKGKKQMANYGNILKKIKSNGQGLLPIDEEFIKFLDRYEKNKGGDK